MLINVKMPTIVGILTFMSRINFVLSLVEHEKSFTTLGPGDPRMTGYAFSLTGDLKILVILQYNFLFQRLRS